MNTFSPCHLNWSELFAVPCRFRACVCGIQGGDLRRWGERFQGALHTDNIRPGLTSDAFRLKARDKTRTGREGRAVSSGEHGQDVFFGPSTAPNSFKRSLDSLRDLMVLIPSDSAVCHLSG